MRVNFTREPQPELYFQLMSILDYCYAPTRAIKRGMNDSAMMRALGVSRKKLNVMRNECPSWPWWPVVLTAAIADIVPQLPSWQRNIVAKKMRGLPEETVQQITQMNRAEMYLLEQLGPGPALASEVLSTRNRGDISTSRIRRAAQLLGVVKTREGKGEDHAVVWSLPEVD